MTNIFNALFYFGTFDPIHEGHLDLARQIQKKTDYEVIFVPAYKSPWKPNITSFEHRLNMINLCTDNFLDIEKQALCTSSWETVAAIINRFESTTKINVLIGMDAFRKLHSWKNAEYLKEHCHFVVVPRPNESSIVPISMDDWDYTFMDIRTYNISSTEIRYKVNKAENLKFLVPALVAQYIDKNCLYKGEGNGEYSFYN